MRRDPQKLRARRREPYPPAVAFQNPCGGLQWQNLPSGLIEIQGEGIPTLKAGTAAFNNMAATWKNWGALLTRAARTHDVPVSWLLAIATMETGSWAADPDKQARIVSPAGAVGVMQVMPATAGGYGRTGADMANPRLNIDTAANLVADLKKKNEGGLPAIAARYNSGRLCSAGRNEWNLLADANYPRRVMEWNNAAILSGMVQNNILPIALAGFAFGVAVALFVR